MRNRAEPAATHAASWHHQPVVWLGILIFLASMVGCAWLIVAGARHADEPLETAHTVFGVPVSANHSKPPAPASSP